MGKQLSQKKNNITFRKGSIFRSKMQTLVNTVNCVGVMGAGLAKKFKEKYPAMYEDYVKQVKSGKIRMGRPTLWKGEKWILNFPTKNDWKNPSKLRWVEEGLKYLVEHYREWEIQSIAFPALGCNLGGLSWIEIRPLMEQYLWKMDIPVEIYIPKLTPIERVLEYVLNDLKTSCGEGVKKVYIIRSLYPGSHAWTNWKKTNSLSIHVIGYGNLIEPWLKKIKFRAQEELGIRMSIASDKEEISSSTMQVSNITINLLEESIY